MIKLKDLLVEQSILKQGMRDPKVGSKEGPIAKLQDKLIQLGHMKQIPDKDYGIYGPMTKSAVKKFQLANKLTDDGIAGAKTLDAMKNAGDKGIIRKAIDKLTPDKDMEPIPSKDSILFFNGGTIYWRDKGRTVKTWRAISGLTIFNTPPEDYDKLIKRYISRPEEFSREKNAGPTPPGVYTLGPLQKRQGDGGTINMIANAINTLNKGDNPITKNNSFNASTARSMYDWGNYRAYLNPKSGKQFGRGSFYIHGGTAPGSHGCIDLTTGMDDFGSYYAIWLAEHKTKTIKLFVDYGKGKNGAISRLWNFHKGEPLFYVPVNIVKAILGTGITSKLRQTGDEFVAKYGDDIKSGVKIAKAAAEKAYEKGSEYYDAAKSWARGFFS